MNITESRGFIYDIPNDNWTQLHLNLNMSLCHRLDHFRFCALLLPENQIIVSAFSCILRISLKDASSRVSLPPSPNGVVFNANDKADVVYYIAESVNLPKMSQIYAVRLWVHCTQ